MHLTAAEIITAATINAACAVGRDNLVGSLEPGKQADAVVWKACNLRQIPYFYGVNQVAQTIKKGRLVWAAGGT